MPPLHVGEETEKPGTGECQNFSKQSDAMPMKKHPFYPVAAVEAIHFHSQDRIVPTLHYSNKG